MTLVLDASKTKAQDILHRMQAWHAHRVTAWQIRFIEPGRRTVK